ncbi:hypothetical protein [Isoptericola sediminis]|uniref:Uncharacterized protein n=1 Tax=Isoptericola sediminis TaxID=2733572 RepID=A0A849K4A9_9MICO|nr:hypothetical protein [Isoptericola sediminis]NNU27661.1 hypothetical protein [Isoptericola sediminis]
MNDDQLIETMRGMAADIPTVGVDRERVLVRGRRRRAARAVGVTGAAGMLCAGMVGAALAWPVPGGGPTPAPAPAASTSAPEPSSDPSPDPSGDAAQEPTSWETYPASPDDGEHAVVDYSAGTIRLPEDDWRLTAQEQAVVETARQYLMVQCLTEAGLGDEVEFVGPVPAYDARQRGLGLWSSQDLDGDYDALAARDTLGVGIPDGPNDTSVPGEGLSEAESAWEDCHGESQAVLTGPDAVELESTGSGEPALAADLGTSYRTEEARQGLDPARRQVARQAREIVVEWEDCLAAEGLTAMDVSAMVPDGVVDLDESSGEPTLVGTAEERRQVAEVDVRCKQTLGTVQRLADLDAAVQVEDIAAHPEHFEVLRELTAEMLANAEDVLEEAGVEMP